MTRPLAALGRAYARHVLPRIVEATCGTADIASVRARVASGLSGVVLEVGFGSGHNLPHLPAAVDRLLAVDPDMTGRRLAGRRLEESPVPVEFVGLDGQDIPLDDGSVDAALCTFTLCSIPDVGRVLGEVRRVLRPGGALHVAEHGLSPEPSVARWQHRLTPVQRRLFGGCHLDRPIDRLLREAGFELAEMTTHQMRGPKPLTYIYEGVVVSPSGG